MKFINFAVGISCTGRMIAPVKRESGNNDNNIRVIKETI